MDTFASYTLSDAAILLSGQGFSQTMVPSVPLADVWATEGHMNPRGNIVDYVTPTQMPRSTAPNMAGITTPGAYTIPTHPVLPNGNPSRMSGWDGVQVPRAAPLGTNPMASFGSIPANPASGQIHLSPAQRVEEVAAEKTLSRIFDTRPGGEPPKGLPLVGTPEWVRCQGVCQKCPKCPGSDIVSGNNPCKIVFLPFSSKGGAKDMKKAAELCKNHANMRVANAQDMRQAWWDGMNTGARVGRIEDGGSAQAVQHAITQNGVVTSQPGLYLSPPGKPSGNDGVYCASENCTHTDLDIFFVAKPSVTQKQAQVECQDKQGIVATAGELVDAWSRGYEKEKRGMIEDGKAAYPTHTSDASKGIRAGPNISPPTGTYDGVFCAKRRNKAHSFPVATLKPPTPPYPTNPEPKFSSENTSKTAKTDQEKQPPQPQQHSLNPPALSECDGWSCSQPGQKCTQGNGHICCNKLNPSQPSCKTPPCWFSGGLCTN
jgi:hypothetical protein